MANQEQVDRLKQGTKLWNAWREEHPDIRPHLLGADLSGTSLRHANLSGADLTRANLRGADLSRAIFNGTNLRGADLSNSFLCYTTFMENDLSTVKGLTQIIHVGPSPIQLHTVKQGLTPVGDLCIYK